MNKYLPSKRFSSTLLSIVIALGLIYGFSWLAANKKNTPAKISGSEAKAKIQEFMALDTDGDGLKDWEEALWKTDPKKTDTDGDGTSDSEEITLNRDPLKRNINPAGVTPSDKVDEKVIADNKKAADDFAKLSETDKMGRILLSQYLATKKVGQTISDTDIASIVQNTLAEIPPVSLKQYSLTDLNVSLATTPEKIKNYGNDTAKIIMDDLFSEKINSQDYDFYGFTQVKNLMEKLDNDSSEKEINEAFSELGKVIGKYDTLMKDLLKIAVPNGLVNEHLTLINAFKAIRDDLAQIKESQNNMILLPSLLASYSDNINKLWGTISDTADIFTKNNVVFVPTDFGYPLFNGIINK